MSPLATIPVVGVGSAEDYLQLVHVTHCALCFKTAVAILFPVQEVRAASNYHVCCT